MRGRPGELRITDQLIQADGYRLAEIHGPVLGPRRDSHQPVAVAQMLVSHADVQRIPRGHQHHAKIFLPSRRYRSSSITWSSTALDGRTRDSGSVASGSSTIFSMSSSVSRPFSTYRTPVSTSPDFSASCSAPIAPILLVAS